MASPYRGIDVFRVQKVTTWSRCSHIAKSGAALALGWTLAGCQANHNVPAEGQVVVESRPAIQGQLFLTPVGGGPGGFGEVGTDGRFALRSAGGRSGIPPGSYRVLFQHKPDPKTRRQMERRGNGLVRIDEMTLTYRGPAADPVVIPESGNRQLLLDIRRDRGWELIVDD